MAGRLAKGLTKLAAISGGDAIPDAAPQGCLAQWKRGLSDAMALRDFALLTFICLVWALNNIVGKLVVSHMGVPPLFYTAMRFAVVMAAVFPWLLPMPRPRWRLLAVALLMGGVNFSLTFFGLKYATPSAAAIVLQLGVPATAILSFMILGERIDTRRAVGICLTIAGALAVMWDPHGFRLSFGLLLIALGTILGSLGAVLIKRLEYVKPLRLQAWVAFASLWPLVLLTALLEPGQVQAGIKAGWPFLGAVLYSAVVVSLIAHTQFYGLIQRYEANLIGSLILMTPLATIGLGVLITHDPFDLRMAFGAAVAIAGVLVVALRPNQLMLMLAALRNRGA